MYNFTLRFHNARTNMKKKGMFMIFLDPGNMV